MTSPATIATTSWSPRAPSATTAGSGPSTVTATGSGTSRPPNDHTEILSSPILVDLNGDGVNDVAVGQAGQFYLLNGRNGASLYRPIEVNRVVQNSAAVADFGPGYGWRLIIQSWLPLGDGLPKNGAGRVESFHLPKAPADRARVAAVAAQRRAHRIAAERARQRRLLARLACRRRVRIRQRQELRLDACTTPEAADRRHGRHAVGPRLLARRTQRERLRIRRCEVARDRRLQASHPADRRDRAAPHRATAIGSSPKTAPCSPSATQ